MTSAKNLPILFRDARYVVLDKPQGLKVHGGPGGGPSVEDWFPALSRRRDGPWLVHRLDADTAGCLVVALRKRALHEAQALFAEGRAQKTYWAVVTGAPPGEAGTITLPLTRRSVPGGWRMAADATGAAAVTDWRLRGRGGAVSWLELSPRTGRTHQIRVHCQALGCPVLGDAVYGLAGGLAGGAAGPPLQLLARAIALPLVPPLAAVAPPPLSMAAALEQCGWVGV